MAGDIRELMGKELLFCDGAMGTMIQAKGIEPGQIPELWNVTEPAAIKDIHRQFLETGVNVIETNTFGANGFKLEGSGYTVEEIVSAGVENAREEADRIKDRPCFVSLSIGPLGKLLKPLGDVTFEEAYDQFAEMVKAGRRADLIIIETMNDTYELKAAILAAKENSDLPVFVSTILDEKGKLLTGAGIEAVVAMAEGLGVDALGFNCGMGPAEMKGFLPELVEATSLPILFSPNAGMPKIRDGQTVFETGPNEFAEHMKDLVAGGVCLAGGCCGTTPEHIKAMIDRCRGMSPVPPVKKDRTVVSSYEKAVTLGEEPVVIGERINPTGKAALKAALKEGDREYVLKEALSQQAQGAHILDINVGLPEIDEREVMEEIVPAVQAVTSLPLQIDTADPKAMEAALRLYNGKAMINSVNGKAESMDAVFPLVKKYGGVCVCLALDEEGIPETAEGRVAVIDIGCPFPGETGDGYEHCPGSIQHIFRPALQGPYKQHIPHSGPGERTFCRDHRSGQGKDDAGLQSFHGAERSGPTGSGLHQSLRGKRRPGRARWEDPDRRWGTGSGEDAIRLHTERTGGKCGEVHRETFREKSPYGYNR